MLIPARLPRLLRGLVTDKKGDGVSFKSGRHRVVDDREFPWVPGTRAVHGRILLAGDAEVDVMGELRVTATQCSRVTATAAEVFAMHNASVCLLLGSRGLLHGTRFEARDNAQAHLHGGASGKAYDESVIFFKEGSTGEVLVLGHRVRLVPPPGRALIEEEARRGYLVRLAPGPVDATRARRSQQDS